MFQGFSPPLREWIMDRFWCYFSSCFYGDGAEIPSSIHSFAHSFIGSFIGPFVGSLVHTHIHTYTHTQIYIYMYTYIHTSMHALFTHTQILSAYQDNQVGVWGNL